MTKGLPYFYVEGPVEAGAVVALSAEDGLHAARSLRLRAGDEITVSDGAGWVARARLIGAGPKDVRAEVESAIVTRSSPSPVRSFVPLLKQAQRTWWAVQKLTEIGVDHIGLISSDRAVVKRPGHATAARLESVVREAAKQSRRAHLPSLGVSVGDWEDVRAETNPVVLWERATEPFADCLTGDGVVSLFVGPEGGLSEAEIAEARGWGARVASLGEPNLRTETAAVIAATLALSRAGRLG